MANDDNLREKSKRILNMLCDLDKYEGNFIEVWTSGDETEVYLLTEELVRRGILEENVMAKDVSRYFLTEEGTQFYDRMVDYFDINLRSLQERE